jgi:hypothetical protein
MLLSEELSIEDAKHTLSTVMKDAGTRYEMKIHSDERIIPILPNRKRSRLMPQRRHTGWATNYRCGRSTDASAARRRQDRPRRIARVNPA